MRILFIFLILLLFSLEGSHAQKKGKVFISEDTKPTLDLNPEEEEEEEEKKKKKRKKKTFYGYKTRRAFTPQVTRGRKTIIETFYVLKTYDQPDPYVKEIYYYDVRKKKLKTARANKVVNDPKIMRILHGPYQRMVNKTIVESGIFYLGSKHGRWEMYNLDSAMVDKQIFYKGWPQESEISYYDIERTQVKEVVPVKWGERSGDYVFFNSNGTLRITGKFAHDKRIGKWRLYHADIQKRHMEVQYAKNPYIKDHKPLVLREWDRNGKQVYDYRKSKEPRFFDEEDLKKLQAKKQ